VQKIERDSFQRCQTYVHIYTTLKFLALQGAPYIYDISRLRVNCLMCSAIYSLYIGIWLKVKVKQSHSSPGQSQKVPGG
jgi:hypothetical protein